MHVFLESIFGQVLLNLYIYLRGSQALPLRWQRQAFRALIILEVTLFLAGFALHNVLSYDAMQIVMTICNTWYFAAIYIAMILGLIDLVRLVVRSIKRQKVSALIESTRYRRIKFWLFCIIALGSIFLIVWGYSLVYKPIITYQTYTLDKPLGQGRNRLRIVLLTDIHMSEGITRAHIETMLRMTNEQKPDIVLVGGDMFDYWSHYGYIDGIPELFRQIQAPMGVYYVMGNHEYRADVDRKKAWIPFTRGHLLIDSIAYPGEAFALVTRDDAIRKGRPSLAQVVSKIDSAHSHLPRVLLEHQPLHLDSLPAQGIDVALYGHTHNGQIFPFNIPVSLAFEKAWGHLKKERTDVYVSCGVGAAGPAIRLFTKSEIVVLDLFSPSDEGVPKSSSQR